LNQIINTYYIKITLFKKSQYPTIFRLLGISQL